MVLSMVVACSENPAAEVMEEPSGKRWTEFPSNPILVPPTCPAWNCLGITDPWLGRQPDGTRMLWVSAGGDAAEDGPVLGRATYATDGTFRFSSSAPELTPADNGWDRWRETVSLTYNETKEQWSIWYLGYRESFFEDPAIGRAVSDGPEGLQFSRPDAPIYRPASDGWDAQFITDPVPIRMSDGRWHLYYVGAGSTVGVGLLISDDGESWTSHPQNPVFERDLEGWDQGLLGIEVKYVGDRFYMWYTGYEEPLDLETTPMSIGQAESVDGIQWSRSPSNPVIEPGPPGAWNGLRVVSPSVMVDPDGTLTMAVHGQSQGDARGGSLGNIGLYELQSGRH